MQVKVRERPPHTCSHPGEQHGSSLRSRAHSLHVAQQSHSRSYTLEKWKLTSTQNLHTNVHSSFICNGPKLGTTQCFFKGEWRHKLGPPTQWALTNESDKLDTRHTVDAPKGLMLSKESQPPKVWFCLCNTLEMTGLPWHWEQACGRPGPGLGGGVTVGSSGGVACVTEQCRVILGVVGMWVQAGNKIALKKHKKPF